MQEKREKQKLDGNEKGMREGVDQAVWHILVRQ